MISSSDALTSEDAARHSEKQAKRKAARDKIMAQKNREGGLLGVHTGKGKGKTTAAMGLALRALGRGQGVAIVQFVKGAWETGEKILLKARCPELIAFESMGEGFTWDTQDRARDLAAAAAAWEKTRALMEDPRVDLLILDEINIALRYEQLPLEEIIAALQNRRDGLNVWATGRNAPQALIDAADLVTEMTEIKHHFRAGFKAQEGVEF